MNASFFVPLSAKLRQSETFPVLLMSDVLSKMIPYHPHIVCDTMANEIGNNL